MEDFFRFVMFCTVLVGGCVVSTAMIYNDNLLGIPLFMVAVVVALVIGEE